MRVTGRPKLHPGSSGSFDQTLVLKEECNMNPRLYRLLEKHQRVDERLREEQRRPFPDWVALLRLKRTKLRIKDVIDRFNRRTARA